MEPRKIACVHKWKFWATDTDLEGTAVILHRCDRCKEMWRKEDPEPVVVIARIE
jgi:hypothetical protein